jgi:Ser/Thr protein kinase RdoA (MazF antagonist)
LEKRIKERYNDRILQIAKRRFKIADDQIRLLDGFESYIYEFDRYDQTYILRISHSLRRSEALIHGEVDWINYIAAGGASVSRAILSEDGNLVEAIDDGKEGYFLATSFVKAPGSSPWEVGWSSELYETYGRLLGKMHALTKHYQPTTSICVRPQWDDPLIQDVESNLPPSESVAIEKYKSLIYYAETLPRDHHSYGLVHFDAHAGNFFVDSEGQITLFDFDDCNYNWFAYDIAIVLFYMVMGADDVPGFTQDFMKHFLRGYKTENQFNGAWLAEFPKFLKMREIDLYAVIHRSFDVNNLQDPWNISYMKDRKYRIENDVPYIDFNFESLEDVL